MATADPLSAAERIFRACQRDGESRRVVFFDEHNNIRSLTATDRYSVTLLNCHQDRVIAVYNHVAELDHIAEDLEWACQRLS